MSREAQVRFREGARVKSPRATRHFVALCFVRFPSEVSSRGLGRLLTVKPSGLSSISRSDGVLARHTILRGFWPGSRAGPRATGIYLAPGSNRAGARLSRFPGSPPAKRRTAERTHEHGRAGRDLSAGDGADRSSSGPAQADGARLGRRRELEAQRCQGARRSLPLAASRPLTRALLMEWRAAMDKLSPSTVNVRLSAMRKLVTE